MGETPAETPSRSVVKLDPKSIAAKVYARTGSMRRASRRSGVDRGTLEAWKETDKAFQVMCLEYRTAPIVKTLTGLHHLGPLAVKALKEELGRTDDKEGDPRRIRAAKLVLETFLKAVELSELANRVKDLEEAAIQAREVRVFNIPTRLEGETTDGETDATAERPNPDPAP